MKLAIYFICIPLIIGIFVLDNYNKTLQKIMCDNYFSSNISMQLKMQNRLSIEGISLECNIK